MKKILLTRGVSNNVWLITQLQKLGFEVLLSHTLSEWRSKYLVGKSFMEPKFKNATDFLIWLKNAIEIDSIDYVIPGSNLQFFQYLEDYPSIKDKIILGSDSQTISLLDNKAEFYKICLEKNLSCSIPFETYNDYLSFLSGKKRLFQKGYDNLCIKPSVGVFASGFHYFTEQDPLERFTQGSNFAITYSEYERSLKNSNFLLPKMIIMPKYEGKEISVDCSVNINNKNLSMCARIKIPSVGQKIICDKKIYEVCNDIVKIFKLQGVFNIQFMMNKGQYKILEVNARPSGGIFHSELSGINLIENLLGEPQDKHPWHDFLSFD